MQVNRYFLFGILLILPGLLWAEDSASLGGVAGNLLEPIGILTDFVTDAALVIGSTFVFASFVKYLEHRKNPLAVPISTVVFLFLMGLILLVFPLIYKLGYEEPPAKTPHKVEHRI